MGYHYGRSAGVVGFLRRYSQKSKGYHLGGNISFNVRFQSSFLGIPLTFSL